MALADAIDGALRPAQSITWASVDGVPEDLTGATLTGTLQRLDTGAIRAIDGSLVVDDATNGVFVWNYSLADVVEGSYHVQFTATFGAGATPAKTFVTGWRVRPALT